jgi:hypothetical protein
MKALLIGAAAAVLAGCTCPAPFKLEPLGQRPVAFQADVQEAAPATVITTHKPPSAPPAPSGKSGSPAAKKATYTVATRKESSPPAQFGEKIDPLIEKAKAAIRAMMPDPPSAEFGEIRRIVKSLLGELVDTVCGHVTGKDASGKSTGEMAFLYIVHDDQGYLVDGNNPMAETGYRNLCE